MRRALISLVAAILAVLPAAVKKPEIAPSDQPFTVAITKAQRLSHAVDRLTFGARPGDLEHIRQQGLDRWLDAQLHPERTPENPILEEKLRPLTSLNMDGATLFKFFPPPQAIKQMHDGNMPLPTEPLLRTAVELQLQRYRFQKKESTEPEPKAKPDPAVVREALLKVIDEKQIATLRKGTPEEKRALLAGFEPGKLDQLLIAMPQGMRRQLMPVASPDLRRKIVLLTTPQQLIAYDLNEAKVMRAVYSNHQLAELMDDFWYNHFNVFLDKGADRTLVTSYEREAIRPNIFGSFRALLEATAHSPAMLFYLDNWESVSPDLPARPGAKRSRGLNENYARELLELHTLGVDNGYTQHDIIEVARCFTGWTIRNPRQGGSFFYNDRVHDKGKKVVLGVTISAGGGMNDGERVLDILAQNPATARFISRKLATRFVADNPPQALLDRMTKTFQTTNGDIREVVRTMITSPEFYSQGAFQAKIKTPFEMTISALRAVDADVDSATAVAQKLNELGQPLYRKIEPTGYSTANAEWMNSSALIGRMNFALALTQGKLNGVTVKPVSQSDPALLAKELLTVPLSPSTKDTIAKAITTQTDSQPALVAALLLGSPEFQRR